MSQPTWQDDVRAAELCATVEQAQLLAEQTPTFDDDGRERVEIATCGTCGRSWNDAAISGRTPAPSARCPFEHYH